MQRTVIVNPREPAFFLGAAFVTLAIAGCHNTAQGVKADTQRAVHKIEQKLDKPGDEKKEEKRDPHARKDDH